MQVKDLGDDLWILLGAAISDEQLGEIGPVIAAGGAP